MEDEPVIDFSRRTRRKVFLLVLVAVLVFAVVLAIVLGATASAENSSFKNVVMERCETYLTESKHMARENDCETIWTAFEQAYIGKDPCDVPPEAYNPLIKSVKQDAVCHSMLFWSKTKDIVHAFTDKRECLVVLEDTLLGVMFDALTWCSKNESKETFTKDCPSWSDCQNNPVRSFWIKASSNFAATACGNVSVMLNGSLETPFSSTSIFGSVEVQNLNPSKVHSLTVLLVTKTIDTTTCDHSSLHSLQSTLDTTIAYKCRQVPYSKVEGCISDPEIPCSDCLAASLTVTLIMHLLQAVILLLGISLAQSRSVKALVKVHSEKTDKIHDPDYFSVSSIIERVNKNAGKSNRDFIIIHGDIAVPTGLQNADPCTSRRCKWPSNGNGNVNVPFVISRQYASSERQVIEQALNSFANSTCIRFVPRTNEEDFIQIISDTGCYSSVGRRGGRQVLSLQREGCVFHHIAQHELLHALGFHHEQTRSDRDDHVRILLQNVISGQQFNFDKVNTNNLDTPYDYNSVMHYSRFAFSSNRQPTIIPIPDNNTPIGRATEMSRNDILRINRLYCS